MSAPAMRGRHPIAERWLYFYIPMGFALLFLLVGPDSTGWRSPR